MLLQLEIFKEVKAIKFGPGDRVIFKTSQYPKEWQTRKLERIVLDQHLLIMEDGLVPLKDITHFRVINGSAGAAGKLFTGFAAGWFLFGGIAHVATEFNFSWNDFVIGAVAGTVGWILTKFISKRSFKIGKSANLRIIDIRFPEPTLDSNTRGYP
ncbi:MAG: hypothetical protein WBO36_09530 [Saprospiraceae bacterium]